MAEGETIQRGRAEGEIRFGTTEPAAEAREVRLGDLSFRMEGGNLRRLSWKGTEVVRGLSAPIRDEGWGTWAEANPVEEIEQQPGLWHLRRRFSAAEGALEGRLEVTAEAAGRVTATLSLRANREVRVSRAGFCLLHPVEGVAGEALTVTHPDGRAEATAFPRAISPSQPVFDIAALEHVVRGVRVRIAFEGETFEMEDQRNWSDASYKTYCRPLALPYPYPLAAGEEVSQTVTISVEGGEAAVAAATAEEAAEVAEARMPDLLLAAEPGWLNPGGPFPARGLLLRLRIGEDDEVIFSDALASLGAGQPVLDLEAILPEWAEPGEALDALARRLARAGLFPRHVIALPEAYLRSYQPTAEWPGEPSPETCAAAARTAFPEARIGLGMLTNFTELNRRPGDAATGDYLTHGSSAIVHAADDASVLETLEALPMIFADSCELAGSRGLRLGLVSIGMRSNPYGKGLSPNPEGRRRTMTAEDPRQGGLLAAAYAVGAAVAAARAGAEAVALAAPRGPFGVVGPDGAARPILHALAALDAVAERTVRLDPVPGLLGVAWETGAVLANASLGSVTAAAPFSTGAVLSPETAEAARDPGWRSGAARELPAEVTLGPCEVLLAGDAAQSL